MTERVKAVSIRVDNRMVYEMLICAFRHGFAMSDNEFNGDNASHDLELELEKILVRFLDLHDNGFFDKASRPDEEEEEEATDYHIIERELVSNILDVSLAARMFNEQKAAFDKVTKH